MRAAAVIAAMIPAAVGCGGATGTYQLELTTAPGSTVLDNLARARMTLSRPFEQVEAVRGDDGHFHLSLEVPADGPTGFVTFEGLADDGTVLAWGRSGALPIAARDGALAIYVAAPQSLAAAPVGLDPARTELGVGRFSFGAILFGGRAADGAPLDDVVVYDVYQHVLLPGERLPAARAGVAVGAGVSDSGYAYVLGGRDAAGATTGTLWRFDATVSPRGAWAPLDDEPALARAGAATVELDPEVFVATGAPPAVIDGRSLTVSPAMTLPALAGTASRVDQNGLVYAVFAGDGSGGTGLVVLGPDGAREVTAPAAARTGHGAAVTTDQQVVVVGGALAGVPTRTALIADPINGGYHELPDVLAGARLAPAVAATSGVVLVAGGRDESGAVLTTAEILDARTLAPVATIPMVAPRAEASAIVLGNGQILIAGGVDASGAPVGVLELYTPAAP